MKRYEYVRERKDGNRVFIQMFLNEPENSVENTTIITLPNNTDKAQILQFGRACKRCY